MKGCACVCGLCVGGREEESEGRRGKKEEKEVLSPRYLAEGQTHPDPHQTAKKKGSGHGQPFDSKSQAQPCDYASFWTFGVENKFGSTGCSRGREKKAMISFPTFLSYPVAEWRVVWQSNNGIFILIILRLLPARLCLLVFIR